MARVTIIGGHGKVALLAAPMLVADRHEVTSVYRNPDHTLEVAATEALAMAEDVETMNVDALRQLFEGQDVVIWSAGAGGGNPERTYAVDRDAAIRSMDAAVAAGVPRYVMVSYFGASVNHCVPQDDPFFHYAQAKAEADQYLRGTALQWTILMPSTLTEEASVGSITVGGSGDAPTSRALVAEVIRAVVNAQADQVAGLDLPFTDGETPIEEALADRRAAR